MLENLAVRADGSVLVVASLQRQLWYAPDPSGHLPVEPVLLHTFDEGQLAQSLVEAEPDLYYVFTYGKAKMHRGDEALGSTWSYLNLTALGAPGGVGGLTRGPSPDPAVRVVELARRLYRRALAACRTRCGSISVS